VVVSKEVDIVSGNLNENDSKIRTLDVDHRPRRRLSLVFGKASVCLRGPRFGPARDTSYWHNVCGCGFLHASPTEELVP